ncbi:MAG: hypothetical protein NTX86_04295 [Candidatus Dependentiae bacterium]|nr:hypothetical protein [Candidatus Dependentiae bacterium]
MMKKGLLTLLCVSLLAMVPACKKRGCNSCTKETTTSKSTKEKKTTTKKATSKKAPTAKTGKVATTREIAEESYSQK